MPRGSGVTHRPRVLVLSNRAENDGLLWNGRVQVVVDDEPLASAVLRKLREMSVPLEAGDLLFFPDSAPKHRVVTVWADE